jgi:hypothetical protein
MRHIEPDPNAVNRLTMGPDGAVHVIPTGTQKASPPPGEMEGQTAAARQVSASGREDLPGNIVKGDTWLPGIRRVPGGGGVCFSYSAAMTPSDRDAARRALRGIRRVPGGDTTCFTY